MGVRVEQYGRYNITFGSTESFTDWNGAIRAPYGYYTFGVVSRPFNHSTVSTQEAAASPHEKMDLSLPEMLGMIALVPLRRELTMPWYRIVARIGGTGGQEKSYAPDFTDPDVFDENITAKRSGELFLFVNDAVIGIPGLFHLFYKNNKGSVRVLITRK